MFNLFCVAGLVLSYWQKKQHMYECALIPKLPI